MATWETKLNRVIRSVLLADSQTLKESNAAQSLAPGHTAQLNGLVSSQFHRRMLIHRDIVAFVLVLIFLRGKQPHTTLSAYMSVIYLPELDVSRTSSFLYRNGGYYHGGCVDPMNGWRALRIFDQSNIPLMRRSCTPLVARN